MFGGRVPSGPGPLEELTAFSRPPSWLLGGGTGKGGEGKGGAEGKRGGEGREERKEGRRGKERGGKEERGKGKVRRDGTTPNKKAGYGPEFSQPLSKIKLSRATIISQNCHY